MPNRGLRYVVTVALAVLHRVGGRQPDAVPIIDKPCEQARFAGLGAITARLAVLLEPCLDRLPQVVGHDGFMFTRVRLPFMSNFSQIDVVLQDHVKRPAREGVSARFDALRADPYLAAGVLGV